MIFKLIFWMFLIMVGVFIGMGATEETQESFPAKISMQNNLGSHELRLEYEPKEIYEWTKKMVTE